MKEKIIIANWKSSKTFNQTRGNLTELFGILSDKELPVKIFIAISPVALSLAMLNQGAPFKLLSQDISEFDPGSHTGEITTDQLQELNIVGSLVGHSERRKDCSEDNQKVIRKLAKGLSANLKIVLCFGEDIIAREKGRTKEVLKKQLDPLVDLLAKQNLKTENIILAYEPIWAIGTGMTADLDNIEEVASWLKEDPYLSNLSFIYGGSVSENNIASILNSSFVDGVLVGSASFKIDSFLNLIRAAQTR